MTTTAASPVKPGRIWVKFVPSVYWLVSRSGCPELKEKLETRLPRKTGSEIELWRSGSVVRSSADSRSYHTYGSHLYQIEWYAGKWALTESFPTTLIIDTLDKYNVYHAEHMMTIPEAIQSHTNSKWPNRQRLILLSLYASALIVRELHCMDEFGVCHAQQRNHDASERDVCGTLGNDGLLSPSLKVHKPVYK